MRRLLFSLGLTLALAVPFTARAYLLGSGGVIGGGSSLPWTPDQIAANVELLSEASSGATGSAWTDQSGKGNHFSKTGGGTITVGTEAAFTGAMNKSVSFDGNVGFATDPSASFNFGTGPYIVAMVIKIGVGTSNGRIPVSNYGNFPAMYTQVFNGGEWKFAEFNSGSEAAIGTDLIAAYGTWHDTIMARAADGTMSFTQDGVQVGTTSSSISLATGDRPFGLMMNEGVTMPGAIGTVLVVKGLSFDATTISNIHDWMRRRTGL